MNNFNVPIKDPNEVMDAINKIFNKRKELYIDAPRDPKIKVEIIKERCKSEYCPYDHLIVNITADYILGEDLLNVCRYLKRNNLPFCFENNTFKVILS